MSGNGSFFTTQADYMVPPDTQVTYDFLLHCSLTQEPNRLHVEIHTPLGLSSSFELDELQFASCQRSADQGTGRLPAPSISHRGFAVGSYNSEPGYCADWLFVDAGSPSVPDGSGDRVESLRIWRCQPEEFVFSVLAPGNPLASGDHQALLP